MKFNIGDIVILTSNRWGDSKRNPIYGKEHGEVFGIIVNKSLKGGLTLRLGAQQIFFEENNYNVVWDNGAINIYVESDLNQNLECYIKQYNGHLKHLLNVGEKNVVRE